MAEDPGRETRHRQVRVAEHSGRMEGLEISPATRELAEEYISGDLTVEELVAKVRGRYRDE